VARRGLLVRHLVLPDGLAGTPEVARFIAAEISVDTYVNVMNQYRPAHRVAVTPWGRSGPAESAAARGHPEMGRPLSPGEHRTAVEAARDAGLWRLDGYL
jgi:putative pyruvate formate lyase activating enzyme